MQRDVDSLLGDTDQKSVLHLRSAHLPLAPVINHLIAATLSHMPITIYTHTHTHTRGCTITQSSTLHCLARETRCGGCSFTTLRGVGWTKVIPINTGQRKGGGGILVFMGKKRKECIFFFFLPSLFISRLLSFWGQSSECEKLASALLQSRVKEMSTL